MNLLLVQEQAITARMALIVGAEEFDRLFLGIQFSEVDGDILFAYAFYEECCRPFQARVGMSSCVSTDQDRAWLDKTWKPGEFEPAD